MNINLRLCYEKRGKAAFLSHLDVMKCFYRAFAARGAGNYQLRYSQGFNPHPYFSGALPLSLGVESTCEQIDVGLAEMVNVREVPVRINAHLPEGLTVTSAQMGGRPFDQIARADYTLALTTKAHADDIKALFAGEMIVMKKSKKQKDFIETDILPMIFRHEITPTANRLTLTVRVAAQNPTLNPKYIVGALCTLDPETTAHITRNALLDATDAAF